MKKILSILLTLAMVFTLMPSMSVVVKADGITWEFEDRDNDDTKETLIFKGEGKVQSGEWSNAPEFDDVTTIIFDDGVEGCGSGSIVNFNNITTIVCPNNFEIGKNSIQKLTNLSKLIIGSNVVIGGDAISNLGIEKLELNGDNIYMGTGAIVECSQLKEVIINGDDCILSSNSVPNNEKLTRITFNGATNILYWSLEFTPVKEIIFTKTPNFIFRDSFGGINSVNLITFCMLMNCSDVDDLKETAEDFLEITLDDDKATKVLNAVDDIMGKVMNMGIVDMYEMMDAAMDEAYKYAAEHTDTKYTMKFEGSDPVSISMTEDCELDDEPDSLGMWYGTYIGVNNHIHKLDNSVWKYDETHHWYECTVEGCTEKIGSEEHDGDTCSVCEKTFSPSIIHESANDFEVTSDTPTKTFTQGETSLSTIHISDLALDNLKANSTDTDYKGILVMNGSVVLTQGTDYTVTEGSVKVNLAKSYLDKLPVGTHNIKVYVKQNDVATATDKDYEFDANVIINAKSNPTPQPEPTPETPSRPIYKVPNTGVVDTTTVMSSNGLIEIGALTLGSVIGLISTRKKKRR